MMMNPRDKELIHAKQEGRCDTAAPAAFSTSSSSRQWSGFKNPRIVRVTRTFGGKDRHSKVSTIRGLRDRRIRLSVPTAIQLYDLQDRLGLSQPSKVIDWLLQATKHDIDGLPPLQIPPGSFGFPHFQHHHHPPTAQLLGCSTNHYHPAAALQQPSSFSPFLDANLTLMNNVGAPDSLYSNSSASAAKDGDININHDLDMNEEDEEREDQDDDDDRLSLEAKLEKINYWNISRSSTEEDDRHQYGGARAHGTSSSTGGNDTNHNNNNNSISGSTRHPAPFPQKFFPIANLNNTTSFFPMAAGGGGSGGGLFNNTVPPHGYYHCDPSNLSLSQFGGTNNNDNLPISQADNHYAVPLPSSSAPYGSPQLYFCPPSPNMTASLAFPLHSSYNINRQHDHEQIGNMRQISRFQLSSANLYPSFHTNDEHHGKPRKND